MCFEALLRGTGPARRIEFWSRQYGDFFKVRLQTDTAYIQEYDSDTTTYTVRASNASADTLVDTWYDGKRPVKPILPNWRGCWKMYPSVPIEEDGWHGRIGQGTT